MTSVGQSSVPRILLYARILMLLEVTRVAGLSFLVSPGSLPSYFTVPFGTGDFLVGLTAVVVVWTLGHKGQRRYAIALTWNALGLVDALFGLAVSGNGGLLGQISSQLGPALYLLPVDIVVHLFVIGVLLTGRVSKFMGA